MCGTSKATVGTSTVVKKGATTDEALASLEGGKGAFNPSLPKLKPPVEKNPLAAPSLTDETLMKARKSAYLKLNAGQGRNASFLSGPVGDLTAPTINKKSLLGY